MSRLIDKDTTIKALHKDPVGALIAGMYNVDGWLEKCEEVHAIPIDWIEAQIPDSTEFYAVVTAIILRHLIDEYRKEQNNEQTE